MLLVEPVSLIMWNRTYTQTVRLPVLTPYAEKVLVGLSLKNSWWRLGTADHFDRAARAPAKEAGLTVMLVVAGPLLPLLSGTRRDLVKAPLGTSTFISLEPEAGLSRA